MSAIKKAGSHEEWLEQRRQGIGSSDIAAVMGFSRYTTPKQVWLLKTGLVKELEFTPDQLRLMRWGNRMEEFIAEDYEEARQARGEAVRVVRDNKIRIHDEYPFLRANLDRIVYGDPAGVGILECKMTGMMQDRNSPTDFPVEYYWQVQHQLLVTGFAWADLAIQVDREELRWSRILPDKEAFDAIIAASKYFWEECVLKKQEPALSVDEQAAVVPESPSIKTVSKVSDVELVLKLSEVKKQASEVKKEEEVYKDMVRALFESNEQLVFDDKVLATWKGSRGIKFDADRFRLEQPELAKKFEVIPPPPPPQYNFSGATLSEMKVISAYEQEVLHSRKLLLKDKAIQQIAELAIFQKTPKA